MVIYVATYKESQQTSAQRKCSCNEHCLQDVITCLHNKSGLACMRQDMNRWKMDSRMLSVHMVSDRPGSSSQLAGASIVSDSGKKRNITHDCQNTELAHCIRCIQCCMHPTIDSRSHQMQCCVHCSVWACSVCPADDTCPHMRLQSLYA